SSSCCNSPRAATTEAHAVPTPAPAATTVCTDKGSAPSIQSLPTPPLHKAKGKRRSRRCLVRSASPMMMTPPRSQRRLIYNTQTQRHLTTTQRFMTTSLSILRTLRANQSKVCCAVCYILDMLSCILGSMKLCSVLSGAMHSRRYIELNINLYRLLLVVNDDCEDAEMVARRNKLLADSTDYLNEADDCGASVTCGDIESGDETEKVDVEIGEYDSYGDLDELVAPDDISDDPDEHDAAECSRRSLWRGRF
ncbi:hypothetical protein GN958_ATG05450, partial [Phytophthora infestans]